jgi:tellurite resistance protein
MADLHLMDYNESDRADYLAVVASMAGADGQVSSEEILALQELCKHFVLGPDARGRVMAATTPGTEDLEATLKRMAATDLRCALTLAWQDGQFQEAEEAEIRRLAGGLGLTDRQVSALMHFASSLRQGVNPEQGLALLEASGVPRNALAMSGTLLGMSLAGVGVARQALDTL